MSSKQQVWSKMSVVQLKAELVKRKLPDRGNKLQLLDRLQKDDAAKKKKEEPVKPKLDIKEVSKSVPVPVNYEKFTIAQLKTALQKRKLSDFGNKIMLTRRLREDDEKANGQGSKEETKKEEVAVKLKNGNKIGEKIKQISKVDDKAKVQVKAETKTTEVTLKQKNEEKISKIDDIQKVVFDEPLLLSGMFNLGYNLMHSLKMVVIKNIAVKEADKPFLAGWLKKAKSSRIGITKKDHCDIVIKYSSVNQGNEAYIKMKEELDDGIVEVLHPNFEYWGAHPTVYWKELSSLCEISDSPVLVEEINEPDKSRNDQKRHCVIENVAADLTEEDLKGTFKEVRDLHVFNYDPTSTGIVLLEFDSIDKAKEYVKDKKEVMVKGKKCPISHYPDRLLVWNKNADKIFGEQNKPQVLSDEDRITRLKLHDEIHKQKKKLLDKEDISGQEKLQEFVVLTERDRPHKLSLISDTQRRLKQRIPFPEPENLILHKTYPSNDAKKKKRKQKLEELRAAKKQSAAMKPDTQPSKPNVSAANKNQKQQPSKPKVVATNKPQPSKPNVSAPKQSIVKKPFAQIKPVTGSNVNNKRTGGQDGYNRSQKFQKFDNKKVVGLFEKPFQKSGGGPPFGRANDSRPSTGYGNSPAGQNNFRNQQNIQSGRQSSLLGTFPNSNSGGAPGHQAPYNRNMPMDTGYQKPGQNPPNRAGFSEARRFPDDPQLGQGAFYGERVPPPNIQQPVSMSSDMGRQVGRNDPFNNRAVSAFDRKPNDNFGRNAATGIDMSKPPPLLDFGSGAPGSGSGGRDKPPGLFDNTNRGVGSVNSPGMFGDYDQRSAEKVEAFRSYTGKFDEFDRGTSGRANDFNRGFTGQEQREGSFGKIEVYKSTDDYGRPSSNRADEFNRGVNKPPGISDSFGQSSSRPADPYTSSTGRFDDFSQRSSAMADPYASRTNKFEDFSRRPDERGDFSRSSVPSGVKPTILMNNMNQSSFEKGNSYRSSTGQFDDYSRQPSGRVDDYSRHVADTSVKPPGLFDDFSQRSTERVDTFRSTTGNFDPADPFTRSTTRRDEEFSRGSLGIDDPFRSSTGKFDNFNRNSPRGQGSVSRPTEAEFNRIASTEMNDFRRSGYQPDNLRAKASGFHQNDADPLEFAVKKITSTIGEQVKEMLRSNVQPEEVGTGRFGRNPNVMEPEFNSRNLVMPESDPWKSNNDPPSLMAMQHQSVESNYGVSNMEKQDSWAVNRQQSSLLAGNNQPQPVRPLFARPSEPHKQPQQTDIWEGGRQQSSYRTDPQIQEYPQKAQKYGEWDQTMKQDSFGRSNDRGQPSASRWANQVQDDFGKNTVAQNTFRRKEEMYDPFEKDSQSQDAFRRNDQPAASFRRDDQDAFRRNDQPMDSYNTAAHAQAFRSKDLPQDVYKYGQTQYDYGFKQNNEPQDRFKQSNNSQSSFGRRNDPFTDMIGGRNADYMEKTSAFRAGRF